MSAMSAVWKPTNKPANLPTNETRVSKRLGKSASQVGEVDEHHEGRLEAGRHVGPALALRGG